MAEGQKACLTKEATSVFYDRRQQSMWALGELQTDLHIAELRAKEEQMSQIPWTLDACKLSEPEKRQLDSLVRESHFSHRCVDILHTKARAAPALFGVDERLRTSAYKLPRAPDVVRPAWLAEVCAQRAYFVCQGFGFKPSRPARPEYVCFSFAHQSPLVLALTCLRPRPWQPVVFEGASDAVRVLHSGWEWDVEVLGEYRESSTGMAAGQESDLCVIKD